MKISLPKDVEYIINTLQRAGYEAYAVGGCVRDTILNREPDDWDITTSAKPMEIKRLFPVTIDTGIQHGTVTVLKNHVGYEVTTYRIDGEYADNRHPKEVIFTANLKEDLLRRDFTINAMAYNHEEGIIDEYGGLDDIRDGIIRCVGNPYDRFSEDALRIMRAVRFSAQLGYRIEEETSKAIIKLSPNLASISAERINTELTKLLLSPNPDYLRDAYRLGITGVVLPELDRCMECEQVNPHHCYSVGEHTLHSLKIVPDDKVLRYTMLFHDFGKPDTQSVGEDGRMHFYGHPAVSERMASDIMHRLKFDNDTMNAVKLLCKNHDLEITEDNKHVRRAMNKLGTDNFGKLLMVKRADCMAQSDYKREEKLASLDNLTSIYNEIVNAGECVCMKDLAVCGRDLIDLGIKPGPAMGAILDELLNKVIDDPALNDREVLLEIVKEQYL
ncbi:MAG: HD domain-containing protein [Lachnospiraceae bacterium]|nr:HD domain-containing protein [Lachnospiraceae bacterium]MDY4999691.1 HD domain-containing protein [Lachnospiraceae bacterium]